LKALPLSLCVLENLKELGLEWFRHSKQLALKTKKKVVNSHDKVQTLFSHMRFEFKGKTEVTPKEFLLNKNIGFYCQDLSVLAK